MKTAITLATFALALGFNALAANESNVKTDNTKMNEKTERKGEITSQDQGTSPADVEMTRKIRQEVTKQNSFSTNAKNVKIASLNGNVVLKGPVKTFEEKQKIEGIAKQFIGGGMLYNEITIAK